MPRFYIQPQSISQDRVVISGLQAHHITNVLRLKIGDEITLFDGKGYEYQAKIVELQRGKLIAHVQAKLEPAVESPLDIVLGQALIKGDKMELIIQKATELGVSRIVPLKTTYSRRTNPESLARKQERWQKIVTEATQQCNRIKLPRIDAPLKLSEFCTKFKAAELKLIFWEQKKEQGNERLTDIKAVNQIALLIGPEGGFTPHEIQAAQEHGFIPLGLGPRILRAETAAIIALTIVQYQLGDLN
jgi:16S rRNA (uracil1498-N3)-methyltransferase